MKKLISAEDIAAAITAGTKVINVDNNTLITPYARDMARQAGIELCDNPISPPADNVGAIDADLIYNAVSKLLAASGSSDILVALSGLMDIPYICEGDDDGKIKLIRGNTVKFQQLDTGNPANKVFYSELFGKKDGSDTNIGLLTIEDCNFSWTTPCEEFLYVIDGSLRIENKGKSFIATAGDILSFKKGTSVILGSLDKVKIFYAKR